MTASSPEPKGIILSRPVLGRSVLTNPKRFGYYLSVQSPLSFTVDRLAEVNALLATLRASGDTRPSVLANIKALTKERRILVTTRDQLEASRVESPKS